MTVWTISWQAGSGGERAARALADRVGVELVEAGQAGAESAAARVASWLADLALPVGLVLGVAAAPPVDRSELCSGREPSESLVLEAARSPCVVADDAAFAILADHPSACHVRIRAPLPWRARRHATENCLSREAARIALARVDRQRRQDVLRAYGRDPESAESFTIVCDASRFGLDELVDVLLAAGRRGGDRVSVGV